MTAIHSTLSNEMTAIANAPLPEAPAQRLDMLHGLPNIGIPLAALSWSKRRQPFAIEFQLEKRNISRSLFVLSRASRCLNYLTTSSKFLFEKYENR